MRVKIIIVFFLVCSIYSCFAIHGSQDIKDESLFVAKTADRNYGEEFTQSVIAKNYDDLLRIFWDMANDFEMNPKEDLSLMFLTSIYFLRNEPENVMELLKDYNEENKSHPLFLYISGNCNAITGNYEKSVSNFTELINEIEKNKIKYQQEYRQGFFKSVPTDIGFDSFEEFLGHLYSHRAFLNVIVGNIPVARDDWKKYCNLSNRPEHIVSFFKCLETMEKSPGTVKCVLKKDFPNDYVKIEEKAIIFRINVRFDWEYPTDKIESLLQILTKQFGELPSSIRDKLSTIQNLDALDQLTDVALDCQSLAEFEAALGK